MIDLGEVADGDIQVFDTQVYRASNLLSVQINGLEYLPDFGIDLRYFLSEGIQFQNESFKAYLVERLANKGINVASMLETVESLANRYTVKVSPQETSTGMIAR